jgi:rubrerythrin
MAIFDSSEVFEIAIRIEENGERFYKSASGKIDNKSVKKIFDYLADEEVKHRQLFKKLLSNIDSFEIPEGYPGEYMNYLTHYAKGIIFSDDEIDERVSNIKDPVTAVDLAIKAETDSILYYQEIKDLVPKEQRKNVEDIIMEEREHFLSLSELKSMLL